MTAWICETCANQYPDTPTPPDGCVICMDERQFVPPSGQRWTSLEELVSAGHRANVEEVEPELFGLRVTPSVGIGQRSLLVRTPAGNLLWEPPGFIDDAAVTAVQELGGIAAIAASHPHMYGTQVEWSHAFDTVPVYVCEADVGWVTRPDPAIVTWADSQEVLPGVRLVQAGGHFPGSCVAGWSAGADGHGVLLVGDTVAITPDQRWASFMRSYPNYIPLSPGAVRRLVERLDAYDYDRIYGSFGTVLPHGAKDAVQRSADRYVAWVSGQFDADT